MLGSVVDAEDAVQESILRAWKGIDRVAEQSSLKTWLYRIATNVCLDTLSATSRQRLRPAVNSALQRARATLDGRNPAVVPRTLSVEQDRLVARYVEAFERYDVSALTALLHEEATLSMPPYDLWLQGHDSIAQWLLGFGIGCKRSRLVPVAACGGTPAFAQYSDNGAQPWALLALELSGDRITSMTSYLDVETLFPRFGLPMRLTE